MSYKVQTYIVRLIDKNNKTIEFERFGQKQLSTVQRNMRRFLEDMKSRQFYQDNIKTVADIVISKGSCYPETEVFRQDIQEFMKV